MKWPELLELPAALPAKVCMRGTRSACDHPTSSKMHRIM